MSLNSLTVLELGGVLMLLRLELARPDGCLALIKESFIEVDIKAEVFAFELWLRLVCGVEAFDLILLEWNWLVFGVGDCMQKVTCGRILGLCICRVCSRCGSGCLSLWWRSSSGIAGSLATSPPIAVL
ncbi:hypothetical protein BpHYR1_019796 [Brachionus plicatilis]|uniref:Uncharacterized protein n=1 Tax=Brachionus plicatilis TaxID=10195 RepID=A0A3M7T678_BRAPC|nr:hypothetical protein BpHYR1_019796 [Brachionus plicatilis]